MKKQLSRSAKEFLDDQAYCQEGTYSEEIEVSTTI